MRLLRFSSIALLILLSASVILAQDAARVATVAEINGTVEVQSGKGEWMPATVGLVLNQGDAIRTKSDSWAVLNVDGVAQTATVEVKKSSQVKLATLLQNGQDATETTLLDLSLGEILIKAKKLHSEKSKFEVKTPTSIVGVRGTTFSVTVEAVE